MTTKSDTDIQELKAIIARGFAEVKAEISEVKAEIKQLGQKIVSLSERQARIEGCLDAWKTPVDKIPELAERVGELKNWRQIALIVITGTFGSLFG